MEGFFDFACREDISDLQEMWRRCFETEDVYSNFYFERRFVPEDTLIWRIDGKAISMMTLMDVSVGGERGCYIYAVATLPEFQHRGVAAALLRQMIASSHTLGLAGIALTCKAEKIGYYARFGFVAQGVSASVHGGAVWYDMALENP